MASFAGGLIGSFFGPIGAMIGSIAGSIVDRALFGEAIVQEGPRISEFRLMKAALGSAVPLVDGSMRVPGEVGWISPIREVKHEQSSKQGGFFGLGGQETVQRSYSYRVDLAIVLAKAPATSVPKIWRQQELVRDTTASVQVNSEKLGAFSIRLGTESDPDPIYEAAVGADNAQAWRGMVVLMLYDHDVTEFGAIPQFSAVVATATIGTKPHTLIAGVDTRLDEFQHVVWAPDRKRIYNVDQESDPSRVQVIDSPTATVLHVGTLNQRYLNDPGINSFPAVDFRHGHFYFSELLFNSSAVTQYDGQTLQVLSQTGMTTGLNPVGDLPFPASTLLAVPVASAGVIIDERLFTCSRKSDKYYAVLDTDALIGTDNGNGFPKLPLLQLHDLESYYGTGWLSSDLVLDQEGTPWLIADNGTDLKIIRLEPSLGSPVEAFAIAGKTGHRQAGYDPATNSLILGKFAGTELLRVSLTDQALTGTLALAGMVSEEAMRCSLKQGAWNARLWIQKDGDEFIEVDTISFTVARTIDADAWLGGTRTGCLYCPLTHSIVTTRDNIGADDLLWLRLDRESLNGVTLQSVMERKATLLGLDVATEISAGGLSADTVDGHFVLERAAGRDSAAQLAVPYFFNPAERDRLLAFVKRGGATVASIVADKLGGRERGEGDGGSEANRRPLETPQAELTLPFRLEAGYYAIALDWQSEIQEAKRHAPAASTRREVRLAWPLAFANADKPKQIVERLLKQQWNSNRVYEFSLGPEFSDLIPTDPISVTDQDAVVHRIIVSEVAIGANGLVKVKGYSEEIATSSAVGVQAPGAPQIVAPTPASAFFLWDGPAPDESFGEGLYLLLAAAPFGGAAGWPGFVLYESADGFAIGAQVGAVTPAAKATLGSAVGALAAPFSGCAPGQYDWTSTVDVRLWNGTLTSSTWDGLLNGKTNLARLGGEYIQFMTAAALGAGVYRLSSIRRGMRGTEDKWGAHAAGDAFCLLTADTVTAVPLATADINVEQFFRGGTVGAALVSAQALSLTPIGRSAMPWAPWAWTVTRNASGDWTGTFRRRVAASNRHDMSGLPIAPQPIDFEVAVLALDGIAEARVITGTATAAGSLMTINADTPSFVYKAADQVTDFGVALRRMRFQLYQVSPLPVGSAGLGRGVPASILVDESVIIFLDHLNETVDTTLASHVPAPIGTAWALESATGAFATSATVVAAEDRIKALADDASDQLVYSLTPAPTSASYSVEAFVVGSMSLLANTDAVGLLARYSDVNNSYGVKLVGEGEGGATELWLYKKVAGVATILASGYGGAFELIEAGGCRLKLEVIGTKLAVYVNDTQVLSATDSAISAAGKAGIFWGELFLSGDDIDDHWKLDNVTVRQL